MKYKITNYNKIKQNIIHKHTIRWKKRKTNKTTKQNITQQNTKIK